MRFTVRKRRTAPAVIIVALIDVLIVLLIFLMVTTTFKQQPAMRLALPESSQALKSGANENPPLIVSIAPGANGQGQLYFGLKSSPVTADQLLSQLKMRVAETRLVRQPPPKLAIRADKGAPWGKVVQVMDLAKEANITVMSAYTKEPGKP
jgi:biopolymer transport protein ExbD